MNLFTRPWRWGLGLCLGVLLAPTVLAQAGDAAPSLLSWDDVGDLDREQARLFESLGHLPENTEVRLGKLGVDLSRAEALELNLFRDADIVVTRDSLEITPEGRVTWIGSVRGEASRAILVAHGDAVSGHVFINRHQEVEGLPGLDEEDGDPAPYGDLSNQVFAIDALGGGVHIVRRIDQAVLDRNDCATDPKQGGGIIDKAISRSLGDPAPSTLISPIPTSDEIGAFAAVIDKAVAAKASPCVTNVLVVYTPAAQAAHGNIPLLAQQAVAQANQAYANSQVNNLYLNLVDARQVAYTETNTMTGSQTTDLARLAGNGDGFMDIVHTWRNDLGADVVVLMTNSLPTGIGGQANAILASTNSAFAVVLWNSATSNYVFAHEVGHLQGARHNPEVDPTTTPFAHGHGTRRPLWNFRTIMSYDCGGNGCPRINNFSNPDVKHNGRKTGDNSDRNNARVLRDTSCQIAALMGPATLGWSYLWGNGGNNALSGWMMNSADRYAVGDFNGDGTDELFIASPASHWAAIQRFNGGGWTTLWSNGGSNFVDWWNLGPVDRFVAGDFIPGNGRDELLGISAAWAHLMVYNGSTWTTVWSNMGSGWIDWWAINTTDRYLAGRLDTSVAGEQLMAIQPGSGYAHLMRYTGTGWSTSYSNLGNGQVFWWNLGWADRYLVGNFATGFAGDEWDAINPNGWSHTNRYTGGNFTYLWGNGGSGAVHWWMIGASDNYVAGNFMHLSPQDEIIAFAPNNGWSQMINYNGAAWQFQWGNLGGWNVGWWYINPGDRCLAGDFATADGWDELLCIQPGNGWAQLQRYLP